MGRDGSFEGFSMGHDSLEVLDADANVELLLDGKVFEIQAVNGNRRLERVSEDF